jgi:tRNA modification GTPase
VDTKGTTDRTADPDTIAAPASADGGAIAVVRVSGPDAWSVTDRIFRPSGRDRLRTMVLGRVTDPVTHDLIDRCCAVYYQAPASYTSEDMTEIFCHGGSITLSRIFRAVLDAGAVAARRGDFTRRAFLNGKMTLSEAEAVAELSTAENETVLRSALRRLEGGLDIVLHRISDELERILVLIEAALQYPEDDPGRLVSADLLSRVERLRSSVGQTLESSLRAERFRGGFRVVLAGMTNAGKSSLFNRLCAADRAIVSDEHATTRDAVEERIVLEGRPVLLCDTAGFGSLGTQVDTMARERTMEKIRTAGLVLLVEDSSRLQTREDRELRDSVSAECPDVLFLLNKSDLQETRRDERDERTLRVSALTGEGMDALCSRIAREADRTSAGAEDGLLCSERVKQGLSELRNRLDLIASDLKKSEFFDKISEETRSAIGIVGRMTGTAGFAVADDVLDAVFDAFCLGK